MQGDGLIASPAFRHHQPGGAASAALLKVARDTPLLYVDRVSYTYGDKPVEFRRGLYRTDRHHYKNELG